MLLVSFMESVGFNQSAIVPTLVHFRSIKVGRIKDLVQLNQLTGNRVSDQAT